MAEKILLAVDKLGTALVKQLGSSNETSKAVVKPNIAIEVTVANTYVNNIQYPRQQDTNESKTDEPENWVYKTGSSIFLPVSSLGSKG